MIRGVVFLFVLSCSGLAQVTHYLTVSRLRFVKFTDADVDLLLDASARILRRRDHITDVAGLVLFKRLGPVFDRNQPSGIFTETAFRRLSTSLRDSTYVYLVNELWWCKGMKGPGPLAGCAGTGPFGPFFAIKIPLAGEDLPITFGHEYGHSKGLQHRPEDAPENCPHDLVSIMYPYVCPAALLLNPVECKAMERLHRASKTSSSVGNPSACLP